jgi:hypothetical protein
MTDTGIQRIYRHESTEFTTVPNWVVRDPNYSPNTFRLLAYLLSHADGYELTYSQIERQTTLGRYAINQAAKFLIKVGWLEWEQKQGLDGRYLAKSWIIKNPLATKPMRNDSAVEPFHYGTTNGQEEEQPLEKNKETRNTQEQAGEFETFWKQYPRHEGKASAEKAYLKALKKISHSELVKALERYKAHNQKHSIIFAHAASWLNAERWSDEYDVMITEVREKAKAVSDEYLTFLREQEKLASPAPKCPHGENVALCRSCL